MAKKKTKETTIIYRVKDEDGNFEDFNSLDELADGMAINHGSAVRYCNSNKKFMGLKIYSFTKEVNNKKER